MSIYLVVFVYVIVEIAELYSVRRQGFIKWNNASHLIQKLVLDEAISNETLIYLSNIILGAIFLTGFGCLDLVLPKSNLLFGLLYSIEIIFSIFVINIISGLIDHMYDNNWINTHENQIKQSSKER